MGEFPDFLRKKPIRYFEEYNLRSKLKSALNLLKYILQLCKHQIFWH